MSKPDQGLPLRWAGATRVIAARQREAEIQLKTGHKSGRNSNMVEGRGGKDDDAVLEKCLASSARTLFAFSRVVAFIAAEGKNTYFRLVFFCMYPDIMGKTNGWLVGQ